MNWCRRSPPETLIPPVTPPEEHEKQRRRMADIEARVRSIEVQRDLAMGRKPKPRPESSR